MRSAAAVARRLTEIARTEPSIVCWRQEALRGVQGVVSFDLGFFHEMSPRSPLERAALLDIDEAWVESTLDRWDEMAVAFEAMLVDGRQHGGVAFASRAFSGRRSQRRLFDRLIARPLGARDVAIVHLVVRGRIIAGLVLARRPRSGHFGDREQAALEKLVAPLSVCDALLQAGPGDRRGLATALECADQRLTRRQQQVVEHVALGHSNVEIARALGISPHTVRNLLVTIAQRLGASNRAEVVHRAVFR